MKRRTLFSGVAASLTLPFAARSKAARPMPSQVAASVPAQTRSACKLKSFETEAGAFFAGQFLRSVLFDNADAKTWCSLNGVPFTKAQDGKFLVPVVMEQAIIALRERYGTFRQEARITPMGSDNVTVSHRVGGRSSDENLPWDHMKLTARNISACGRVSLECDSEAEVIRMADDLAQELAYAFMHMEDTAGWKGNGSEVHSGIAGVLHKINSGEGVSVTARPGHSTFRSLGAEDIFRLMKSIPEHVRNAKFYGSHPAWRLVFQRLIAEAGGNPDETLTDGRPKMRFLGYPVVIDQTLPLSTGSLAKKPMLLFGDLSMACRLGDRRGITIGKRDGFSSDGHITVTATEKVDINWHSLAPVSALIGGV